MDACLRQNCVPCAAFKLPLNHLETVPPRIFREYTDEALFHYMYGQRLHCMRKADVEIMETIGQGVNWHNPRAIGAQQHAESDAERWAKFGPWVRETIRLCPS